eukprot:Rhum_TRINITY_DN13138_c0_g1::Rhum_TRINITY_DN13138_c0_g1_i1::g.57393::m.57393
MCGRREMRPRRPKGRPGRASKAVTRRVRIRVHRNAAAMLLLLRLLRALARRGPCVVGAVRRRGAGGGAGGEAGRRRRRRPRCGGEERGLRGERAGQDVLRVRLQVAGVRPARGAAPRLALGGAAAAHVARELVFALHLAADEKLVALAAGLAQLLAQLELLHLLQEVVLRQLQQLLPQVLALVVVADGDGRVRRADLLQAHDLLLQLPHRAVHPVRVRAVGEGGEGRVGVAVAVTAGGGGNAAARGRAVGTVVLRGVVERDDVFTDGLLVRVEVAEEPFAVGAAVHQLLERPLLLARLLQLLLELVHDELPFSSKMFFQLNLFQRHLCELPLQRVCKELFFGLQLFSKLLLLLPDAIQPLQQPVRDELLLLLHAPLQRCSLGLQRAHLVILLAQRRLDARVLILPALLRLPQPPCLSLERLCLGLYAPQLLFITEKVGGICGNGSAHSAQEGGRGKEGGGWGRQRGVKRRSGREGRI